MQRGTQATGRRCSCSGRVTMVPRRALGGSGAAESSARTRKFVDRSLPVDEIGRRADDQVKEWTAGPFVAATSPVRRSRQRAAARERVRARGHRPHVVVEVDPGAPSIAARATAGRRPRSPRKCIGAMPLAGVGVSWSYVVDLGTDRDPIKGSVYAREEIGRCLRTARPFAYPGDGAAPFLPALPRSSRERGGREGTHLPPNLRHLSPPQTNREPSPRGDIALLDHTTIWRVNDVE